MGFFKKSVPNDVLDSISQQNINKHMQDVDLNDPDDLMLKFQKMLESQKKTTRELNLGMFKRTRLLVCIDIYLRTNLPAHIAKSLNNIARKEIV